MRIAAYCTHPSVGHPYGMHCSPNPRPSTPAVITFHASVYIEETRDSFPSSNPQLLRRATAIGLINLLNAECVL